MATQMSKQMTKAEMAELLHQQKDHIRTLMERLEMREDMYDEKKTELAQVKEELDALRKELAELKKGEFDCDVYWTATDGDLCLYKIPKEIACLNTTDGDNAVLEAIQNGYFGTEWGSYSGIHVVEMTREMIEEHIVELKENKEEPESESEEADANCSVCGSCGTWLKSAIAFDEQLCDTCADAEDAVQRHTEPTPKSTKDLVIDQLNEEPLAPAFEPLHEDATHQVVRGYFTTEYTWKVPAGINLRDTHTYEFGDKWGTLYISNTLTGEDFEIEDHEESDDFKRAYDLEVEDRDDDDNTY